MILSSGVWMEKFENEFKRADMSFVSGTYTEADADVPLIFLQVARNPIPEVIAVKLN